MLLRYTGKNFDTDQNYVDEQEQHQSNLGCIQDSVELHYPKQRTEYN